MVNKGGRSLAGGKEGSSYNIACRELVASTKHRNEVMNTVLLSLMTGPGKD